MFLFIYHGPKLISVGATYFHLFNINTFSKNYKKLVALY